MREITGSEKPNKGSLDYIVRKGLDLPLEKKLVYVDVTDKFKRYEVESFEITEEWETWTSLTVFLKGITKGIRIHRQFFSEMQNPRFREEYIEQIEEE